MDLHKEVIDLVEEFPGAKARKMGLVHNPHDVLKRALYYANSEYLSGKHDEFGRRKPFYNTNVFRWNVAVRAVDFDTKDFGILPEDPEYSIDAMVFTQEVRHWMDETNFAEVLNKFSSNRTGHGEAILKKTYKDGNLKLSVVDPGNIVFDPNDVFGGLFIEIHEMTKPELSAMKNVFGEEKVDEAMELFDKDQGKEPSTTDTITVYEVHGMIEKDGEYKQMKYFLTGEKEEDQIELLCEEEDELPYRSLKWRERPGFPNAWGVGVLEDGFEAQEQTNDMVLKQRDILEIISKIGLKTDDDMLDDNMNVLENGFIWQMNEGKDVAPVQFNAQAMPQLDGMLQMWDKQYEQVSSTFESITGETMPSSTPYRSVAIQNKEASSLFAYRREEAGTFWEGVFTDWVIPEIAKKIDREHLLSGSYTGKELKAIDEAFGTAQANKAVKESLKSGKGIPSPLDYQTLLETAKLSQQSLGEKRYLNIPKGYFKNFKGKVRVITTNEQRDKAATLESLDKILNTAATAPQILQVPSLRKIFANAVDIADVGIHSYELEAEMANDMNAGAPQQQRQPEQQVGNEAQENKTANTAKT